jgi:hypothetical protein
MYIKEASPKEGVNILNVKYAQPNFGGNLTKSNKGTTDSVLNLAITIIKEGRQKI